MFLIVGVLGSRERKIRAAYQFFIHTSRIFINASCIASYICFQTAGTDLQVL